MFCTCIHMYHYLDIYASCTCTCTCTCTVWYVHVLYGDVYTHMYVGATSASRALSLPFPVIVGFAMRTSFSNTNLCHHSLTVYGPGIGGFRWHPFLWTSSGKSDLIMAFSYVGDDQ